MHTVLPSIDPTLAQGSGYFGLRLSAQQYLSLDEDGNRYELIDGVVCMSPSATSLHQRILARIVAMIDTFLESSRVGDVFVELDVDLSESLAPRQVVYRPDAAFVRSERSGIVEDHVHGAPDLVVEVASWSTRRYDAETKRGDYERAGVLEYWIIDPERQMMTFFKLREGRFVECFPEQDRLTSDAVPGFVLELNRVRSLFPRK